MQIITHKLNSMLLGRTLFKVFMMASLSTWVWRKTTNLCLQWLCNMFPSELFVLFQRFYTALGTRSHACTTHSHKNRHFCIRSSVTFLRSGTFYSAHATLAVCVTVSVLHSNIKALFVRGSTKNILSKPFIIRESERANTVKRKWYITEIKFQTIEDYGHSVKLSPSIQY